MNLMVILIAAFSTLIGWLLYERSKRKSAEALNDNIKTKEEVLEIQKDVVKNEGLIDAERIKREEMIKKLEEEKNKDVSNKDLLDFFNKSDK